MHHFNELKQRSEQESFMRYEYHIINLITHSTHIPSYEIFFCVAFLSSYIYISDWMSAKWKSDLPHRKTNTRSKWSSEIHIWIFHEFNILKSVSRSNLDDKPECYFAVFLCFSLVCIIIFETVGDVYFAKHWLSMWHLKQHICYRIIQMPKYSVCDFVSVVHGQIYFIKLFSNFFVLSCFFPFIN